MLRKIAIYSLIAPLSVLATMLTSTDGLAWPKAGGFGARPFYQTAPRVFTFQPRPTQSFTAGPSSPALKNNPFGRILGVAPKSDLGRRASQSLNMSSFGFRQSSAREKLMTGTSMSSRNLRTPTQSEIRRGFTGRFTSDGRALVRLRDQIVAVPASQVSGAVNKFIFQDPAKTNWTVQREDAINAKPRAVTNGSHSVDQLSEVATVTDRGGLTAAGRALQKHGGRQGSVFPEAKGSPLMVNKQGQYIVDDILTNPGSRTVARSHARFGKVTEIRSPDGRGVRYGPDGKFIGFLEPTK